MGKDPESGNVNRTVGISLLYAVPVPVLHPFVRFFVPPGFSQVDGWLAAALAGGAAGAVAPRLVGRYRRT